MPLLTKRGNSKLLDTVTLTAHPTRTRTSAAPIRDWLTMSGRSLRMSRRNIEGLMTSVALPVLLMLIFVYLFGGAINTGTAYVTYVVPGVLVLCAGFGSAMTAVSVCNDMTTGVIDRFRSMDVSGAAVVGGHVVASVVRNAVSTALVLGVALLIGFRPHAGVVGVARGRRHSALVHPRHLVAVRRGGPLCEVAGRCQRLHVPALVSPLSQQRIRAHPDDADMAPWLCIRSAGDTGHPVDPRVSPRSAGRDEPLVRTRMDGGILVVSVALCAVIFQRRVE